MPKSSSLSLAMRSKGGKDGTDTPVLSPRSPTSPTDGFGNDAEAATPTHPFHTMPDSPSSPRQRKDSRSIFSNFHASRSSSRIVHPDNPARQITDQSMPRGAYADGDDEELPSNSKQLIGTPNSDDNVSEIANSEEMKSISEKCDDVNDRLAEVTASKRATAKPKKQGVLSRSRSTKLDDGARTKQKANAPKHLAEPPSTAWRGNEDSLPLKTAPLEKGQSWRQNISFGKLRTHSADRHEGPRDGRGDDDTIPRKDKAEQGSLASSSFSESRGAALMSSLGSASRKMGEKMETARKGMFGKLGRSSSNHDKDLQIPKEQYQFRIINRGLVEQTRLTRISKRLEHSKDKTEFWMPALPWRCIDYLNLKGCEEEGLYRVPGAAHTVRYYEQKFDQDRDIDLIADDNLNDPNVIGSLFKNWLRQLPDEIFPKAIQARIQQECQGVKQTPQLLKDELSKLPPFNYYLLFAITCHISLLHSCAEYNKMNYSNLCICFQPAIKIDAFCFQFLILDWRNCWQGCWTEKEYLAEELKYLDSQEAVPPPTRNGHSNVVSAKGVTAPTPGYLGSSTKPTSNRSLSSDRTDASDHTRPPPRTTSSERVQSSGRATPPAPGFQPETGTPRATTDRRPAAEGPTFPERIESKERGHPRSTPKRAPSMLNGETAAEEEDNSATPTQAQHTRGASDSTYRLEISNPPSSPFSIKF